MMEIFSRVVIGCHRGFQKCLEPMTRLNDFFMTMTLSVRDVFIRNFIAPRVLVLYRQTSEKKVDIDVLGQLLNLKRH